MEKKALFGGRGGVSDMTTDHVNPARHISLSKNSKRQDVFKAPLTNLQKNCLTFFNFWKLLVPELITKSRKDSTLADFEEMFISTIKMAETLYDCVFLATNSLFFTDKGPVKQERYVSPGCILYSESLNEC